ncbi:SDR family NAD(P)-dependent oxidoreductase [Novosphingobium naphthalenivorans]|uniref:SDR family NAD(P)-dependent oxidoreductase n=1 Tax=Novosphingobium naphthalenivorans TaxID=273168 RepID=UPI00082B1FDB|nr:glucose 1-dehydrogenase [Novosphingobium naphthalenivorans]
MTSLQGKIALVTGAASGIGRATAIALAQRGARVVLSDLDERKAQETIAMMVGEPPLFIRCDVSSEADVTQMFDQIRERFGQLDIACNIAGVGGRKGGPMFAPIAEAETADFDFILAVNVRGPWLCMREEMKMMTAQKSGAIVNLSSVLGKAGMAGSAPYAASKHAIIGLTKSVALEGADCGVRVNAVCPGAIATPLVDALVGEEGEARKGLTAAHPIGRLGTAEEVAQAIVWLCSDESTFVTGSELVIDGAYLAQ